MTPQYNAEHIASRIRQPLNTWPGNCFAIATAIVEAGIVFKDYKIKEKP